MAEPLSIAASIAGLLSLTIQVVSKTYTYGKGVRNARRDIDVFTDELKALRQVLQRLEDIATSGPDPRDLLSFTDLMSTVNNCKTHLFEILQRLEKDQQNMVKAMMNQMTWPLKEKETLKAVEVLHRYVGIFSLALSAEGAAAARLTLDEVKAVHREFDTHQEDQRVVEMLSWMSNFEYQKKHQDVRSRRVSDTGQWLIELPQFKSWCTDPLINRTLWCSGIPGAGKTIITSIVIDHIKKHHVGDKVGLAYFYCDYRDQEVHTAANVVSSLLRQLCAVMSRLPEPVTRLYERLHKDGDLPDLQDLQRVLQELIAQHYDRVYVAIDALDECDATRQRKLLLGVLKALTSQCHSLRLFITSRPHPQDIRKAFTDVQSITITASQHDIRRYLDYRLSQDDSITDLIDDVLKKEIVTKIVEFSQGMFLLPALQIQTIMDQTTRAEIRTVIQTLPIGLSDVFESLMGRIQRQPASRSRLAIRTLEWITRAKRPLLVNELLNALAIVDGQSSLDEDNVPLLQSVIEVCSGLVLVDEQSSTMRLVHFSLQEHFDAQREAHFVRGDYTIAKACITYLNFNAFSNGPCADDTKLEARLQQYPLLVYAAQNWGVHARGQNEQDLKDKILDFLQDRQKLSSANQAVRPKGNYRAYRELLDAPSLHIAAKFGLLGTVATLLDLGADVNVKDRRGRTALQRAAANRHADVVELLLARGAAIDEKDSTGRTALHWVAFDTAMAELLLDKGADIEAKDNTGRSALLRAIAQKSEHMVKFLLSQKGCNLYSEDEDHWTPLTLAAERGNETILRMLLDVGCDVKRQNVDGPTPLHKAASSGFGSGVQLLLEHGADATATDHYRRTPLHLAARHGCESVVQVLLEWSVVGINSKDLAFCTPLMYAVKYGYMSVASLLLEHRADRKSALFEAVLTGDNEMMRLLLERGPEAMSPDELSDDLLSSAAGYGHEDLVKTLLEKGAKFDVQDNSPGAPLWNAVRYGHEGIVQLLLRGKLVTPEMNLQIRQWRLWHAAEKGNMLVVEQLMQQVNINPNLGDGNGRTPLWLAANSGHEAVVRLLLNQPNINLDVKDCHGRAPFHATVSQGRHAVLKLLIKSRPSIATSDYPDYLPLHEAVNSGHMDVVRLLLKSGADKGASDRNGITPLMLAAFHGHAAIGRLLLDEGADLDAQDSHGETALFYAVSSRSKNVVQLLLERGADGEIKNEQGQKAYDSAVTSSYMKIARMISKFQPKISKA